MRTKTWALSDELWEKIKSTGHPTAFTAEEGFFERLWISGLPTYDEMEGIGWEWQSIDGSLIKAPLALKAVGRNPTDLKKKERSGVPWWTNTDFHWFW